MKKVLFLTIFLICQLAMGAQGVPTATLHHAGDFKTFYSANGFKAALAEAQPGDIINLSAGTFVSTPITVPVTIRGAGIGALDDQEKTSKFRTVLTGTFVIDIPDNEEGYALSMEGIECQENVEISQVNNPVFSKMKLKTITYHGYYGDVKMNNITLFHCIFDNLKASTEATIMIYNCVFPGFSDISSASSISVFNSNIIVASSYYWSDSKNTNFSNCIFDMSSNSNADLRYAQYYDCVVMGSVKDPFLDDNALKERNNRSFPQDSSVFVENTYYRLTDEAAAYLGGDGTQVGIYGSSLPFSAKTSYPQIKKFAVSPETTPDGKLKIELEIDAVD